MTDEEPGLCLDDPDEEVVIAVGRFGDQGHTYVDNYIDSRRMHVCSKCSAVVADIDAHHAWHQSQEPFTLASAVPIRTS